MYKPSAKILDQLQKTFVHHTPHGDQAARYKLLRDTAAALTNLETSVMFANAAIARHEGPSS